MPDFEAWCPGKSKALRLYRQLWERPGAELFCHAQVLRGEGRQGRSPAVFNNRPYFHNGVLDQGYWPDGLYTAPTDEAMIYDISTAKAMGFNMLRSISR